MELKVVRSGEQDICSVWSGLPEVFCDWLTDEKFFVEESGVLSRTLIYTIDQCITKWGQNANLRIPLSFLTSILQGLLFYPRTQTKMLKKIPLH